MQALTTDEQRLKEATKALQRAAGGVEVCGEITGTGKSQHGNYQNQHAPDFITVDRVAKLEAVTHGSPHHPQITRLLCRLAGGIFVPLPEANGTEDALSGLTLTLAAELGDVSAEIRRGLADDGMISPAEAMCVLEELDQLDRASAQLRMLLVRIAEAKPELRSVDAKWEGE